MRDENLIKKGLRKWMYFPNFTAFLLNPLVKPHEYLSETSYVVKRTGSRIGYADPFKRASHQPIFRLDGLIRGPDIFSSQNPR